jgi:hypothetical protein
MACSAVDDVHLHTDQYHSSGERGKTDHGPSNEFFFSEYALIAVEIFHIVPKPGKHPYRRID